MQKIKLKTEESGKKLLEAYAPPKWSETADDDDEPNRSYEETLLLGLSKKCSTFIFNKQKNLIKT